MDVQTAISLKGLSKQFGNTHALTDVSMDVPRQCVFGLVGPNGAGKTTLFSLVSGFLRPSAGNISVLGIGLDRISDLRGRLSILPQDAQFQANVPIIEQLVYFSQLNGCTRAEAEKEAADALAKVGLGDSARKGARMLSHGMAKRMGIAQAFLGQPEVILLDEPTAGLDPASAKGIRDLIDELRTSATIVISSHDLSEIQEMCSHVAILDHGKLVAFNLVSELTSANSQFRVSFNRLLNDEELTLVRSLPKVTGIQLKQKEIYLVSYQPGDTPGPDPVILELLGMLLTKGVFPRMIQEGEGLESRFLEITKKPDVSA